MLNDRSKDGGNYSDTGSSAHYKDAFIEFIDDVELQYGTAIAYLTCVINEQKYRSRAGKKAGVSLEKDIVKAKWYNSCARHLMNKINGNVNYVGRPFIEPTVPVMDILSTSHSGRLPLGTIVDQILKA